MKPIFKQLCILIFVGTFFLMSCRKEEMELVQAPDDQVLVANSTLANLMLQTAMNDGSFDNILDKSNCFNIKLPITVKANGQEINLDSSEDLNAVEYIYDTDDDDEDTLEIDFPITIVLNDFSEVVVENITAFNSYSNMCNGENQSDSDIECLDFQYPIMTSIFNTANELIETLALSSDFQLFNFLEHMDQYDIVNLKFPIQLKLLDDTEFPINNINELQTTIESYRSSCDEDDDYDYNDDDCDDCTREQLKTYLTNCSGWSVDKMERNYYNYDNAYEGYDFNFYENGTISVYWSGYEAFGTYATTGSGNDLTVVINIPDLPYCNNNWILHEIQSYSGETRVDFRVGNVDRLRYVNNCN